MRLAEHCACVFDGDELVAMCWAHLKQLERNVSAAMSRAFAERDEGLRRVPLTSPGAG